jgi:uncharacterized protein (DUF1800 family)
MTISFSRRSFKNVFAIISFAIITGIFGSLSETPAATNKPPTLISDSASTRAIALESVTLKGEPFALTSTVNFSSDTRTRICIFAMNLELLAGEGANAFSADVQDASGKLYSLKVEHQGPVPGFPGITMLIVRLADDLGDAGDVLLRLNLHGVSSNRVRLAIGHLGGGPADDLGSLPTPAPVNPPAPDAVATPNPYTDPAFASGSDGIRFLEQSTWGPADADLAHIRAVGYASWLNEQFNAPPLFSGTQSNYPAIPLYPVNQPSPCDATCVRDNYTPYSLQRQFFTNTLSQPDQLRQRVAFALHKMLVINARDMNGGMPSWYAPYLNILDHHAFGNFRQVLFDITLNPGMGNYLDMAGNSRTAPNENYSREIMQLFSIGVDTLNQDGTPVFDANGNRVPSYDQAAITNLARVFTGWNITTTSVTINGTPTTVPDYITPMSLVNNTNTYDIASKTLLTDINHPTPLVLPACTNCTSTANYKAYKDNELNLAIDNLFNHPNTGPYLCTQLIHQLVTSNPSPAYVGRCSATFANNGSGVRGDMKAVITTILLDIEARGDVKNAPAYGHLREPVLLMNNLLRTFNATSDGVLASTPFSYANDLGQDLFSPPTVFSYFPADYGLPGTNIFGPEFGILDTSTSFKRANFVNTLFLANSGNGISINLPNRPGGTQTNYSSYQALAGNPQQLVDALESRMTHGTMSAATKSNIVTAVTGIAGSDPAGRTRAAIYLIATSSQYQVER